MDWSLTEKKRNLFFKMLDDVARSAKLCRFSMKGRLGRRKVTSFPNWSVHESFYNTHLTKLNALYISYLCPQSLTFRIIFITSEIFFNLKYSQSMC